MKMKQVKANEILKRMFPERAVPESRAEAFGEALEAFMARMVIARYQEFLAYQAKVDPEGRRSTQDLIDEFYRNDHEA